MRKLTSLLTGVAAALGWSLASAQTSGQTATAIATGSWVNVSEAFTKEIGVDDLNPAYLNRCQAMIVTPDGDVMILTAKKGICVSKDQGASWSVVADNEITGRCEHGFGTSIAYPYDGRIAVFSFDGGQWGTSGGFTADGGKTWQPFTKVQRGPEFGDVYWNPRETPTVYAVTHEPYYSLLSVDGGKSWRRLDKDETGSKTNYCVGIIDVKTLTRYNPNRESGSIELSEDAGRTWSKVADHRVTGRSAVHFGTKLYWTTAKGVITSTNGKDWTLTGEGAEGASYGPYFGSTDREFVVVTKSSFLKTEDGGKSWKPIADIFKAPDIFKGNAGHSYFGWDSRNNILYASGVGASVYKLPLEGAASAKR